MFLVIDVTNGASVEDGQRTVVEAEDAAAAAQVAAEQGTGIGRRDFIVFDVAAGVAESNEAVRVVQPVTPEAPAETPVEEPPVEEPAPNPEG